MRRREIVESDITYNRQGKLSDHQRFRMRMDIIIRGLVSLIPVSFLLIILYVVFRGEVFVDISFWVILGIMALVIWLLSVPAFRYVFRLASDLRGTGVAEDCGVLTLEVYSSAVRTRSDTKSYIAVDNQRHYVWNSQIEGGFKNNEYGCVYFGRNSKLVLSIETFTEEQIEKM